METKPLLPALQHGDLPELEKAAEHMRGLGYTTSIAPISEITDPPSWMQPEAGGFVLALDADRWEEGLTKLGEYFGYSEPEAE